MEEGRAGEEEVGGGRKRWHAPNTLPPFPSPPLCSSNTRPRPHRLLKDVDETRINKTSHANPEEEASPPWAPTGEYGLSTCTPIVPLYPTPTTGAAFPTPASALIGSCTMSHVHDHRPLP